MFYNCCKLKALPDLSKWDTRNVIFMNGLFSECKSLISLPDISKWPINNIKQNTSDLLQRGPAYTKDRKKLYLNKFHYIRYLFFNCQSLQTLPDISKWDTSNVNDMSFIFYNCSSLKSLPDISKWDTHNVTDMEYMFYGCSSLLYFPDISKWNINNLINIDNMLGNCNSLIILPNLELWKINKEHLFNEDIQQDLNSSNSHISFLSISYDSDSHSKIYSKNKTEKNYSEKFNLLNNSFNEIDDKEINLLNKDADENSEFYERFYD